MFSFHEKHLLACLSQLSLSKSGTQFRKCWVWLQQNRNPKTLHRSYLSFQNGELQRTSQQLLSCCCKYRAPEQPHVKSHCLSKRLLSLTRVSKAQAKVPWSSKQAISYWLLSSLQLDRRWFDRMFLVSILLHSETLLIYPGLLLYPLLRANTRGLYAQRLGRKQLL